MRAGTGHAAPGDAAVAELARQFDRHPLVMIGELHKSEQIHAFLQRLLHDKRFICYADDVVIEAGNSRLQPLADAYVAGRPLNETQIESMWRETVPPLTWNSPLYRNLYETVRAIDATHLCPRPVRLVLADTPIDWSKVRTLADYRRVPDRDRAYADVVERAVLARHQRALLIAGEYHARKRLAPEDRDYGPTVAQILAREHPGALFATVIVPSADAATALGMDPPPSLRVVDGTPLAMMDAQLTDPDSTFVRRGRSWVAALDKHWGALGGAVDGVLYVGPNTLLFLPPTIYLDPAYQKELRRRAAIIKSDSGQDFGAVIDGLVKQAKAVRPAAPPTRSAPRAR